MSTPAASSAYWRIAGMSYLKYANVCADMVRSAVKSGPAKDAAKARETVYYRSASWEDGKPQKTVITEIADSIEGKTG
uniref:F-type H+-transporting ATPase subunit epsilon n=1 Tax=Tetraselmis sp. GSL018 TaxID=582737 RepID=A0A061SLE6_9CHLO|eukprot:CAMPEP_0177596522 /NCGR_PEP_ID=MMETSP0419_2-20121207/11129_1 /TAXON_ID=582737 /ORGANISM="Tetraselmis sp., Strain GSL018" /LENGTH=77 /DNA_ID=CAMNT_0019088443 /DNA_START=360 /DNA_END=593 /DNA_ORIENTATION=-